MKPHKFEDEFDHLPLARLIHKYGEGSELPGEIQLTRKGLRRVDMSKYAQADGRTSRDAEVGEDFVHIHLLGDSKFDDRTRDFERAIGVARSMGVHVEWDGHLSWVIGTDHLSDLESPEELLGYAKTWLEFNV